MILAIVVIGCEAEPENIIIPEREQSPTAETMLLSTAIPTAFIMATEPPTATLTVTATPSLTPTATATRQQVTLTFTPTEAIDGTVAPTQSPVIEGEQAQHFYFERPIEMSPSAPHRVDYIDRTYPYGGTQFGRREVHLGVEFANIRLTPVIAVADGVVIFAGSDDEVIIGPRSDYYGQVIVIEHDQPSPAGERVFTLYAHLERVLVSEGQRVTVGDKIGNVGDTGIADGPHLHFEVRVDEPFNYLATRNPDLWIKPYTNYGLIAGRVNYADPEALYDLPVLVRRDEFRRETTVYGGDRVNGDTILNENFAIGDLPEGTYEVIVSDSGRILFRESFDVVSNMITWVDIDLTGRVVRVD